MFMYILLMRIIFRVPYMNNGMKNIFYHLFNCAGIMIACFYHLLCGSHQVVVVIA